MPSPFAAIVPVGPGSVEVERTRDLLESLFAYEPEVAGLVLVDDAGHDRGLQTLVPAPASCRVVSLLNPPHARRFRYASRTTAMLLALRWVHTHLDVAFSLRLDTDALVIGPFADKVVAALTTDESIGIAGSYDVTCNGELRDFSPHEPAIHRLLRPWRRLGRSGRIREIVRTALANGYQPGEHCLGGALAVSRGMTTAMQAAGHFDDPMLWCRAHPPDDVVLGIYARAVGLRSMSFTDAGQPFALHFVGLPDSPERLQARAYSLIHSVKNDAQRTEAEIRDYFRSQRHGSGTGAAANPDVRQSLR